MNEVEQRLAGFGLGRLRQAGNRLELARPVAGPALVVPLVDAELGGLGGHLEPLGHLAPGGCRAGRVELDAGLPLLGDVLEQRIDPLQAATLPIPDRHRLQPEPAQPVLLAVAQAHDGRVDDLAGLERQPGRILGGQEGRAVLVHRLPARIGGLPVAQALHARPQDGFGSRIGCHQRAERVQHHDAYRQRTEQQVAIGPLQLTRVRHRI